MPRTIHPSQPSKAKTAKEPQAFAGAVRPVTIPSLIQTICASRETGVLVLREGRIEKSAYIDGGKIVFARSNNPDDRLGEYLLQKGLLSVLGFERCTDQVVRTGRRLGEFLVEQGLLSPEDLVEAVRAQVRAIIDSMFHWVRGSYAFLRGPLPSEEAITLKVNTAEVIRTGIQGIHTWSRIREAVGDLDTMYRSVQGFAQMVDLPLSPREKKFLQFCSTPTRISEICCTLPLSNFEVCRMIWAFLVLGALERTRWQGAAIKVHPSG